MAIDIALMVAVAVGSGNSLTDPLLMPDLFLSCGNTVTGDYVLDFNKYYIFLSGTH